VLSHSYSAPFNHSQVAQTFLEKLDSLLKAGHSKIEAEKPAMQQSLQNVIKWLSDIHSEAATNILKITNIIDLEKIEEDEEYEDVYRDLKKELDKIGKINSLVLPRVKDGFEKDVVGSVFVEFMDESYAQIARFALKVSVSPLISAAGPALRPEATAHRVLRPEEVRRADLRLRGAGNYGTDCQRYCLLE